MQYNRIYFISIILLFVLVIISLVLHFQPKDKIAFIRSSVVLSQYEGMVEATAMYNQKTSLWQANIDTLTKELNMSIAAHQRDVIGMTEKEKELSKELLETKRRQLVEYSKSIEQKAKEEDAILTGQVYKNVNQYLEKYGKEHGYKIIFAANETGNIVYGQDAIDLTEEILEGMNNAYAQ